MNCQINMILKCILGVLFLVCAFSLSSTNSQELKKFASKGNTELGGVISFQWLSPVFNGKAGEATTIFSLAPYAGLFIFDGFEVGINPVDLTVINQHGTKTTQIMIFAAPSYHLNVKDTIYPFIEGLLGYTLKSSKNVSTKGFSWGTRTGVKLAVIEGGLLNFSLQYLEVTMNPEQAANRSGFNQLLFLAGWTVWF